MKTLKKAFVIYIVFILLSVINSACCGDTYFRIVGSGYISAFDYETNNSFLEDSIGTITGAFGLTVSYETSGRKSAFNLNPIQSVYATSCPQTFENDLDENSLIISTDKEFTYDGIIIEPGTNLIDLEAIIYFVDWVYITVDFDDEFMSKSDFIDEVYELKIDVNTTDSLELENTIRLDFGIE